MKSCRLVLAIFSANALLIGSCSAAKPGRVVGIITATCASNPGDGSPPSTECQLRVGSHQKVDVSLQCKGGICPWGEKCAWWKDGPEAMSAKATCGNVATEELKTMVKTAKKRASMDRKNQVRINQRLRTKTDVEGEAQADRLDVLAGLATERAQERDRAAAAHQATAGGSHPPPSAGAGAGIAAAAGGDDLDLGGDDSDDSSESSEATIPGSPSMHEGQVGTKPRSR